MFPPPWTEELDWFTPSAATSGLPPVSEKEVKKVTVRSSSIITPSSTQPCFGWPSILPNMTGKASGISRMRYSSMKLVHPFGLSNGWAELAL